MVMRICPSCGLKRYSANAEGEWKCEQCGCVFGNEHNRPPIDKGERGAGRALPRK